MQIFFFYDCARLYLNKIGSSSYQSVTLYRFYFTHFVVIIYVLQSATFARYSRWNKIQCKNGKREWKTHTRDYPLGYATYGTHSNNSVAVSQNYIAAVARYVAALSAKRIHDALDVALSSISGGRVKIARKNIQNNPY